jgi:hypothetical protein
MFRGPFLPLACFLGATAVCTIFLPFALLFGYPWLIGIAIWYTGRWMLGRLEKPAEVAAIWTAYLGLILILHGAVISFDTALAGTPPTAAQKRFGNRLAYVGAAIALTSIIVAYTVDLRRRIMARRAAKSAPLDDLAIR